MKIYRNVEIIKKRPHNTLNYMDALLYKWYCLIAIVSYLVNYASERAKLLSLIRNFDHSISIGCDEWIQLRPLEGQPRGCKETYVTVVTCRYNVPPPSLPTCSIILCSLRKLSSVSFGSIFSNGILLRNRNYEIIFF